MKVFDWENFWEEHPRKQLTIDNVKWANLRPVTYDYKQAFAEIKEALDIQKTDRVLEVGCGTGEMLPLLTKLIPARQVAALDMSQTMINVAKTNHPDLAIFKSPAHMIQMMDDSFDKVYCSGVIQHIATPFFQPTILEMLRVTKMGGLVFIGDVLETADPAAEVFVYPKKVWEEFGEVKFLQSSFEKRLNVVITKTKEAAPTFVVGGNDHWGVLPN